MTEFCSKSYTFGAFFDTSAQISFVFTNFLRLCVAAKLFKQIIVFDGEDAKIENMLMPLNQLRFKGIFCAVIRGFIFGLRLKTLI